MNKSTYESLKCKIRAGMNRFLGEDAPYWNKEAVVRLVNPLKLDDSIVTEALNELAKNNELYLVRDDKYYFIITEQFVINACGSNSEVANFCIKEIKKLKENLGL